MHHKCAIPFSWYLVVCSIIAALGCEDTAAESNAGKSALSSAQVPAAPLSGARLDVAVPLAGIRGARDLWQTKNEVPTPHRWTSAFGGRSGIDFYKTDHLEFKAKINSDPPRK